MKRSQLDGLFALAILALTVAVVMLTVERREMREVKDYAKERADVITGYMSKPPWVQIRRTHETLMWDLHVRVSELEGADADTVRVWETTRAED